jgi:hypothetical protein
LSDDRVTSSGTDLADVNVRGARIEIRADVALRAYKYESQEEKHYAESRAVKLHKLPEMKTMEERLGGQARIC